MEYMLAFNESENDFAERTDPDSATAKSRMGAWGEYIGALMQAGLSKGGNGPAAAAHGHDRPDPRRQEAGAGRPDRRHQGTARRLHDHRSARSRHGAGLGRQGSLRGDGLVEVRPVLPPMPRG